MPNMALVCANDFIKRANEEGLYLNKTKLLKLVYFMFGHYLAKTGEDLFSDKFQAWQYGPVSTKIYNKVKRLNIIKDYIEDEDGNNYITSIDSEYGKKYYEIFDYVWNKYSPFSSSALTNLSHAKGSPWAITFFTKGEYSEINNDLIKRYFRGEELISG